MHALLDLSITSVTPISGPVSQFCSESRRMGTSVICLWLLRFVGTWLSVFQKIALFTSSKHKYGVTKIMKSFLVCLLRKIIHCPTLLTLWGSLYFTLAYFNQHRNKTKFWQMSLRQYILSIVHQNVHQIKYNQLGRWWSPLEFYIPYDRKFLKLEIFPHSPVFISGQLLN